jgi:4-hydroxysphinganine ceramide fatty acyl 2-hydroxylase
MSIDIAGFVALGVLTWTFLEYVMHRWLGHHRRFRWSLFAKEHVRHHIEGNYFAPSWIKAILGAVLGAVLAPLASLALGADRGLAYVAGLLLFYGAYEALHRRHHTHPGIGAYGRWARRHHFYHHFENARMNHGVTSPLWDIVFGTYRKPAVIHVPAHLCMSWLRDPETGRVRREHAATFVIQAKG